MHTTTHTSPGPADERPSAPLPPAVPDPETRGCLFALSQPPLMLFLTVIGALLGLCGAHDLFWL